jgi:hypothetical protein
LHRALVDVASECLCLGLPGGLLCGCPTGAGVGDGQVFADPKTLVLSVFDGIQGSSLSCADIAGPGARNLGGMA